LDWYDYGARMYDAAIGRFMVQDAYAEKYLDFSPYQYGANNPLLFVDINGDSLWISYGDNQRVLYQQGMEFDGEEFASNIITLLNSIGQNNAGKSVIGSLIDSDQSYTFQNTNATDQEGNTVNGLKYERKGNREGGVIHAASLSEWDTDVQVEGSSHELFHAFQDENYGFSNGHHVGLEVEGYIFGSAMRTDYLIQKGMSREDAFIQSVSKYWTPGSDAISSINFQESMSTLVRGYNSSTFNSAIKNFRNGTSLSKHYKNTPIRSYSKPLIKGLYPLVR